MNFVLLFLFSLILLILFLFSLFLISNFFKYLIFSDNEDSSQIGARGEIRVSKELSFLSNEYYVLNDVLLRIGNRSSQIDHIVVSIYGIFVIETKNYKGWIFGSEKSRQWTQNLFGEKYFFQNPIIQNKGHIYTLKKALKISEDKFISIIAFSSEADLKNSYESNVIYISEINDIIASYNQQILSQETVEYVISFLNEHNIISSEGYERHILKTRQRIQKQNTRLENGICPRCGGKLIIRHGKYGDFIGCNNYPDCRFTTNLY